MARVLVINDDDQILDVYEDVLRSLGHEPVVKMTASSGPEVVRDASADALIVDLQRPDESEYGLRIIEELRQEPEMGAFPIVLATGAGPELEPELARLQALQVQVVRKPFAVEDLESALKISFGAEGD
jgi:two-component system OmpR family response regulator/two-component system phosphate regulon response regulator PhoB